MTIQNTPNSHQERQEESETKVEADKPTTDPSPVIPVSTDNTKSQNTETEQELPVVEESMLPLKVIPKKGDILPALKKEKAYYYEDTSGNPHIIQIIDREDDKLIVKFQKLEKIGENEWQLVDDPEHQGLYQTSFDDLNQRLREKVKSNSDPEKLARAFKTRQERYKDLPKPSLPPSSPIEPDEPTPQPREKQTTTISSVPTPSSPTPNKKPDITKERPSHATKKPENTDKTQTKIEQININPLDPLRKWVRENLLEDSEIEIIEIIRGSEKVEEERETRKVKTEAEEPKEKEQPPSLLSGQIYQDKYTGGYYLVISMDPARIKIMRIAKHEERYYYQEQPMEKEDFLELIRIGSLKIIKPENRQSTASKLPREIITNDQFRDAYFQAIAIRAASKKEEGKDKKSEKQIRPQVRPQAQIICDKIKTSGSRWKHNKTNEEVILIESSPVKIVLQDPESGEMTIFTNPAAFVMQYRPLTENRTEKESSDSPLPVGSIWKIQTKKMGAITVKFLREEGDKLLFRIGTWQNGEFVPQERQERQPEGVAIRKNNWGKVRPELLYDPSQNQTNETNTTTSSVATKERREDTPLYRYRRYRTPPSRPPVEEKQPPAPSTDLDLEAVKEFLADLVAPEEARELQENEIVFIGKATDNNITGHYARILSNSGDELECQILSTDSDLRPILSTESKDRESIDIANLAYSEDEAKSQNKYICFKASPLSSPL